MTFEDIQHHLAPENIGQAPISVKLSILLLIFMAVIGTGLFYDTNDQFIQLEQHEKKEIKLKGEFKIKANKAAKLEIFKQQLEKMQVSFGALLRQLPEKTDVESLLVDISQTGLASGLEIKKFKPDIEKKKIFYAELPIILEVSGSFHQLASFISGIAALPRIVTIHDLKLSPITNEDNTSHNKLSMSAIAKTYRYLQEDEQ
jgi:type IV pilus assembly protein PilO|tara:strand:- start:619 stop:1224 length:606 start_codon:yes stop_codon:yes gene_type:complete